MVPGDPPRVGAVPGTGTASRAVHSKVPPTPSDPGPDCASLISCFWQLSLEIPSLLLGQGCWG